MGGGPGAHLTPPYKGPPFFFKGAAFKRASPRFEPSKNFKPPIMKCKGEEKWDTKFRKKILRSKLSSPPKKVENFFKPPGFPP